MACIATPIDDFKASPHLFIPACQNPIGVIQKWRHLDDATTFQTPSSLSYGLINPFFRGVIYLNVPFLVQAEQFARRGGTQSKKVIVLVW